MSINFSRRNFVLAAGGISTLGLLGFRELMDNWGPRTYLGKVWGASFSRGHRLFKKSFPPVSRIINIPVSIVGSGISGLSCAYHLKKMGIKDFKLFDLEDHVGGKSHAYNNLAPWGAHYLPLVNLNNASLLNFLEEAKIIKGFDDRGIPEYDELMVCSGPMEKLYLYGRMQDGIVPHENIPEKDKEKIEAFQSEMHRISKTKGKDGKFAFDIPMEHSSQDEQFSRYDHITMLDYLKQMNFDCETLNWYVNYCCRDDFGTTIDQISAWAGIHYFTARRGVGKDLHENSVLTWPEGNKFLVDKLMELSQAEVHKGYLLFKVSGNELFFYDFENKETVKVVSKQIVLALPQFILAKIFDSQTPFEYSPWMVANLKIKWDQTIEKDLAWDNVNYHGKGLGVVSSNQQKLYSHMNENILTYYWPLTHLSPKEARKFAIKRTHEKWCEDILEDVSPMIFDIDQRILSVDIWPWGHGMIRPTKNFITQTRKKLVNVSSSHIHIAHTDLGGLSLFEEGFYRGEVAAKRVQEGLKS